MFSLFYKLFWGAQVTKILLLSRDSSQSLRPCRAVSVCTLLLLAVLPMLAQAGDIGLSAKGSTLGTGLEIDYAFTEKVSFRLQNNGYLIEDEFEESDIDYDGEIKLSTLGLLVDWHVFSGSFRLSAGFYANKNHLKGLGEGSGFYEIGDREYASDPNDPIQAGLKVNLGSSTAPFLGFGWGNSPKNKGGFMASFDLGVLFTGAPDVSFDVSGTAVDLGSGFTVDMATDPSVQGEVDKEVALLKDDLSDFELYPVIMFGLGYRF